jgi:hypothetical protein
MNLFTPLALDRILASFAGFWHHLPPFGVIRRIAGVKLSIASWRKLPHYGVSFRLLV